MASTFTTDLTDFLKGLLVTIRLRPNHKTCYATIVRNLDNIIHGLKDFEVWETGRRQGRMKEEDMYKIHVHKENVARVQKQVDSLLEKHGSSSCHRTEVGQEIWNLNKKGHKLMSYMSCFPQQMQWQAVICNPAIRQELLMEDILQGMTEEQRKDKEHLEIVWPAWENERMDLVNPIQKQSA
ncbi:hypothetical protein DXG01_008582 [Tephrocybe rancida]|nr:hypothetical protein DXG01_008582 [Tephrocybe rancida]